ncbi:hypothetical protein LINGRAHAP2_LOCUS26369 [Linum grandiflorum]
MRNINGGRVYSRVLAQAWSSSQSGGRWFSSSIRRSREERKAMIESFVNEYAKSNNGRFPPINLTQKEVGGRFYVVRHILQELKATWTPDQANELHRGAISEKPQSSASLLPNGTVTVPDEHPRLDGEGEQHPSNDTSAASKQEGIENPICGQEFPSSIRPSREERKAMIESFVKEYKESNNGSFPPINVIQKEVGGGFHVVRHILQELKATWSQNQGSQTSSADEFPRDSVVVLSGVSSKMIEELSVVVDGHPIDTRNDTEIQGGVRLLENIKQAEELPKVVVSIPSLEIRDFVEPITVPTDDREEKVGLNTRNKGSRSDKDGSLEQSCLKSNKVVNDTSKVLDVTSARQSNDHQHTGSDTRSMEESRVEVVPEQKAKTIGASLKSFVVDAFRKLWSR